jgi:REP element-mobilizing transposase RayT
LPAGEEVSPHANPVYNHFAMNPVPFYTPQNVCNPAYHLRYMWSGWPSNDAFPPLPPMDELKQRWETDGLRLLEQHFRPDRIQFTFSVKPDVSPVFFATRVKGRLQHAYRTAGQPAKFSRKVCVRTIGRNHRSDVEAYIQRQVANEPLADPRYRAFLEQFTAVSRSVDLSVPSETLSGRYWYNLHLVLVSHERHGCHDAAHLATLRDQSQRIAEKKGHHISTLSAMPDHLHLALRGNIDQAPQTIALSYMNNLAYALGKKPLWQFGYYVGSFGDYDMNAVRRRERTGTGRGEEV